MFRACGSSGRGRICDDKVLTPWNGLMIAAFARAARVVRARSGDGDGGRAYLEAARRAARSSASGCGSRRPRTLLRRYRDGHAEIDGYAEDYAYLDLRAARAVSGRPGSRRGWSGRSRCSERQDELFWDEADGGWFSTTGRDPRVLLRMKEDYDGAEPTASSVSVLNLLVLSHLVEDRSWTEKDRADVRAVRRRASSRRAAPCR